VNKASKDSILQIIVDELKRLERIDRDAIENVKRNVARRYRLPFIPKNFEIYSAMDPELRKKLTFPLVKPVRSISGIVIISVFAPPYTCPGRCIYCPGGVDGPTPTPKSYSGHEPAARRAAELNYDPFLQIRHRVKHLEKLGHPTDKISLIVMGGTFLYMPKKYRDEFVRGLYEGILGERISNMDIPEMQALLERSKRRLVELTFETRPDFCLEKHVDEMLYYGATRVEIGVQTLSDNILRFVRRGHSVEDIRRAFRVAKDAGLKIVAHMMPNLPPDPDPKRDFNDFVTLFEDPDFKPDMLKIYPTAVVKGTELYRMWIKGEYRPYDQRQLVELLARVKRIIPPWIRIMRLQRDIPTYLVEDGYKTGNLRQLVLQYMKERGWHCRCIRCREIGHRVYKGGYTPNYDNITIVHRRYNASDGIEVFISYEDPHNDVVIGILRLRKPSEYAHRPEIDANTAIIRELHVYGPLIPLGRRERHGFQHRGYGRKLLMEAERYALEEFDCRKIVIISGIGVREYYRRFGYRKEGPYMSKNLSP